MKFIKNNFWVLLIPFLFLPNDLFPIAKSSLGSLQLMDVILLIFSPFWLVSFLKIKKNRELTKIRLSAYFLLVFILLTVLILPLKFPFISDFYYNFSMMKALKFLLYVLFGLFLMDRFQENKLDLYNKAIRFSIFIICLVIILNFLAGNIGDTNNEFREDDVKFISYSALNVISVALAILSASQLEFFFRKKTRLNLLLFSLVCSTLLLSGGRGGTIAFICALIVYQYQNNSISNQFKILLFSVVCFTILYTYVPEVQYQIDRTINPDSEFLRKNNAGVAGLDDGKRLSGLLKSFPKWFNEPLLGYGFFHRGGYSKLATWGSHNFYLQMLLEVGLIGVILFVIFFKRLNQRRKEIANICPQKVKSIFFCFLAAFVGGLSGEYFYGGEALLSFMLSIIPLGVTTINKCHER